MMTNNIRLTVICLLANIIAAGFVVPMGILSGPIANEFNVELTSITKQFSLLTGSYFIGSLVAFFILDYVTTRLALILYSLIIVTSAVILYFFNSPVMFPIIISIIGLTAGITLCVAGTIISKIWSSKRQQVVFLSQDAAFSFGGAVFPIVIVALLFRNYHWTIGYLLVASLALIVLFLTLSSKFDFEQGQKHAKKTESTTEWNFRIIIIGICMFMSFIGKYIVMIWLPTYMETTLSATATESGEVISRIFACGLIGALIGTVVVSRIKLSQFIGLMIFIGFVSSVYFTSAQTIGMIKLTATAFGLVTAVLWNAFAAYAISFVETPTHKHVSYIFFCGGLATAVTPFLSSLVVDLFSISAVLNMASVLYGAVLVVIVFLELTKKSPSVLDNQLQQQ